MLKKSFIKIITKSYIWVFIFIISSYRCSLDGEPNIFIIPENYTGRVTVIFNHSEGIPKKYEGKYRVFKIDNNGCCLSQFRPQYEKWIEEKFFLIDSTGNRVEIETHPGFRTYEEDTTGLKRIFNVVSGDFSPEHPDLHFYSFLICKSTEYKELLKLEKDMEKCLGIHDLYLNKTGDWYDQLPKRMSTSIVSYSTTTKKPILKRGDLVFFNGLSHAALATSSGENVYTFWAPPDKASYSFTLDEVKVETIGDLVKCMNKAFGPTKVTIGKPVW